MNKNAVKKYAVWARTELITRVSQRAMLYGITTKNCGDPNADSIQNRILSPIEKRQRKALIQRIQTIGYDQTIEAAAYTWFNRFAALRFMEVNNYLPSHIRIFTNDAGEFKPQILAEAIHLDMDGLDKQKIYALEEANQTEELFKYLLVTQCNALNSILPGMFQRIDDYTELLLPDHLLRQGSVIEQLVTSIPEEDWTDQVQIIGWLYQYYNAELKDKVFADLKKNIKITRNTIPAATQLFTPDWIVHYMVENSLGRLWLEGHPAAKSKFLPKHNANGSVHAENGKWNYYLEEAEQEPEVQTQLAEIRKKYAALKPEEIRVIDPCMGSGHILCVLFDVLVQMYEDCGCTQREAAAKIVENNLWGLDIDDRAAQLAYFAVMMKARQYDRRFFARNMQPHVYAVEESNGLDPKCTAYFIDNRDDLSAALACVVKDLYDAKDYGSILNVSSVDFDALFARFDEIRNDAHSNSLYRSQALDRLLPLVQTAQTLAQKYDVVVTNPPYMGNSGMNVKLADFVKKNYPDSKSDLFAVFIERCSNMMNEYAYQAMITQHSWMFLSSFEKLREKIADKNIINMAHLGARAFEEIGGEVVQTTSFVRSSQKINHFKGTYCRLIDPITQQGKEDMFLAGENRYVAQQSNFSKIPGSPMAYWVSEKILSCFVKSQSLGKVFKLLAGTSTGDNTLYQRFWYEVNYNNISLYPDGSKRWFPCNTGGSFYKYASNNNTVIDWENDGYRIRNHINGKGKIGSAIRNREYYFRSGITWNKLSSSNFGVRFVPNGYISDDTARMIISHSLEQQYYLLAFLCSNVCQSFLALLSPTLSFTNSELERLPYFESNKQDLYSRIINLSKDNHFQSLKDVSSFETSWDFARHPLLRNADTVKEAYSEWSQECDDRFSQLKANEEELNRIFIDIYGLQDELTPEVEDKDVTVRKADLQREIKSLISYAVGCMFGRYSLDRDGLVYAGGEFSDQWLEVGGQYCLREEIEHAVGDQLSVGSDQLSVISDQGAVNSDNDLCSPEILDAITSGDCSELVQKGWKNAERIDWKAIRCTLTANHYHPDADAIIPICDDEYFEDDIVGRFVEFVELVYGRDTLEENLQFIADVLGGKGSAREVIRSYFISGFYADHVKIYQKRPIYWLFDSGKKNGFKCLIYMHRYQPDTIARIRTDYIHEQQSRYRTIIADLEQRMNAASSSERVKLNKKLTAVQAQSEELRGYEEKIHHLADQMIAIDLDDGVKVNYAKFGDVLAKIK